MQSSKRKAQPEPEAGPSAAAAPTAKRVAAAAPAVVHPARVRALSEGAMLPSGPVVYLMSRDQRAADNWALLHAAQRAAGAGRQLAVAFTLFPSFAGTSAARHFGFMLRGLAETAAALEARGIPFLLLRGQAAEAVPPLLARLGCSLLVTDFSPLREGRAWRAALAVAAACPVEEVDAHNVVPVWRASPKLEYAARTIRPKINAALPEFLTDFPPLPPLPGWDAAAAAPAAGTVPPDWPALISEATRANSAAEAVPEVDWLRPGEAAAAAALSAFLQPSRLRLYEKRNDPNCPQALSGLSPYLHYGQVSAQRCALAARAAGGGAACDSFLEELVVRKELSDNFCLHNPHYDSLAGASEWARASLAAHAGDKREHLYGRRELEEAKTADRLWNATQLEMVHTGKMHGWCRMYWAKKILEWTESPEVALREAIYLNDKYSLDGRDPNGYVGCMWSIAGIHDMGWAERPVFGKIRYMNFAGAKRKFDVEAYINRVGAQVRAVKAKAAAAAASGAGPSG